MTFLQLMSKFHREESGQDLLEYGLVLLAVLTAVVAGSNSLAGGIGAAIGNINGKIQGLIT